MVSKWLESRAILTCGLSYLVHLWLHYVRQLDEGSLPVFRVVEMWSQHALGGSYVDKNVDKLLVFVSFYHFNATRVYLNKHIVKYIGAISPNRFKLQCDMLRRKVRKGGDCAGIFNKTAGETIIQYYAKAQHGQREAKIRTAMSNAYQRNAHRGTRHHRPAINAYKKKFGVCDLFNSQIKHRIWPHRDGGKGTIGDRGKQGSFAFGCISLNTFNAFRDMNHIADAEYDYYSFCAQLANDLYTHALNLSEVPL